MAARGDEDRDMGVLANDGVSRISLMNNKNNKRYLESFVRLCALPSNNQNKGTELSEF